LFTGYAFKKGSFHFRDDLRGSDDYSSKRDKPVDFCSSDKPHHLIVPKLGKSDLQLMLLVLLYLQLLLIQYFRHIELAIQVPDNLIKERDHFSRKVDQLIVHVNIKLLQMKGIDLEDSLLHDIQF